MELPGHVTDVSSAVSVGQLVLQNDLHTAIEAQFGEELQVLYPDRSHVFESSVPSDRVLQVCMRDDASICGSCSVPESTRTLRASESFGRFRTAEGYLQLEKEEVEREQQLRLKRKEMMRQKLQEVLLHLKLSFLVGVLLMMAVGVFGYFIFWVEPEDDASATILSGVSILYLGIASTDVGPSVPGQSWIWKCFTYNCGFACYFLAALGIAAVLARYVLAGFWWSPVIAGPPFCIMLFFLCRRRWQTSLQEHIETGEKEVLNDVAGKTIVFNGEVLPNGKRVCSWPGKYESAWDSLVQHSRDGKLSAAVVFLPEGSEQFGVHDQIPRLENLGESCWCVPLYGEKKPWGCRWWSKWMANVEQAVRLGVELEVYFFKGMKGKGKVGNFLTAGIEHLRREAIQSKRAEFLNSQEFQIALDAGIEGLCKELRGDSSSQYSREVHRLFLASLPEEDRTFMMASEGLGNSQKAEVAWLEKKGYAYTEVEVDLSAWLQ